MPRNITVTFDDGSSHVYQNAPDDITPQQVTQRAQQEFQGKSITHLDGGKQAPQPQGASDASHGPVDVGALPKPNAATDIPPEQKEAGPMGQPMRFGGSTVAASSVPAGPTWEQAQQKLKDLQSQGVQPNDPRFQQALRERALGLQRLSSGGYTSAANIGGAAAAPLEAAAKGAGSAIAPAAAKVAGIIPAVSGRDAVAASKGLLTDALGHIESGIKDAKQPIGVAQTVEDAGKAKPNADVVDIKQTAPDVTAKLSQARNDAQIAVKKASQASTKLDLVKQQLASADKYSTGPNKSLAAVRGLRRQLNVAQREADAASAEKDAAADALKQADKAAKDATQSDRKVSTSQAKITKDAAAAKKLLSRYEQFRAELTAPGITPKALTSKTRSFAQFLKGQGRLDEKQYSDFLGKINGVETKFGQTQQARDALRSVIKHALTAGGVGIGLGAGSEMLGKLGL